MFKKFLKFVFPMFIFFAFIIIKINAVEEYPLWVGNQQVTSENLSGTAGDGSWSFSGNSSGGTLTLNNATITALHDMNFEDYPDWRYRANISCDNKNFDLTIKLIGNNILSGSGYGIFASQNTYTITGPGSLNATNRQSSIGNYKGGLSITNGANITANSIRPIETTGLLTISDSTISAEGKTSNGTIQISGGNDLVISNSNLHLTNSYGPTGGYAICAPQNINISNSTINIEKSDTKEYSSGIQGRDGGNVTILNSSINVTVSSRTGISLPNMQLSILGDSIVTSEGDNYSVFAGSINHTDELIVLEPEGGRFSDDLTTVLNSDGSTAKRAVITVKKHPVRFLDEDGTELQSSSVAYGETPSYNGQTPTKPADAQYTYTFNGWDPAITSVTGDKTYTATYSQTTNKYTVEFVNYDNALLESKQVDYGVTPEYTGETPTKPADAQYTYSFDAWTPSIVPVAAAATYTATYNSTVNEYTITFVDEDGTELQSSNVAYGVTPEYTGRTPTKPADDQYTYTFAGWDPEIVPVAGETTYTAVFSAEARTDNSETEGDPDDVTPISDDEEEEKAAQETDIDAPKTGDETNIHLWLIVMLASSMGLVLILIFRKKYGFSFKNYR